jgi:glucose 1-dehydrogenase
VSRLITRRLPLEDFADGFARRPDDVKVVLELAQ